MEEAAWLPALAGGALGLGAGLAAWWTGGWLASAPPPEPDCGGRPGRSALAPVLFAAGAGLWGAYAGWTAGLSWLALLAVLLAGLLLALSRVDFLVRRIPDVLLLALLGWGLAQIAALGQPTVSAALLGLLTGGAIFFLLATVRRGAMGAGDVKLAATIGAVLGFPLALEALLCGALAGGIAALWLLGTRRAGRKDSMAYGPYLAFGAWLMWTRASGLWP